jgi:secondary thiamine-phosphate synthase enzyme
MRATERNGRHGTGLRFFNEVIKLRTTKGPEFVDITDEVLAVMERAAIRNGFAVVYSKHTTAAVRINENEPLLLKDMECFLERVAPADAYYNHNDFTVRTVNMTEDECPNGHAHCQQLLMGASETVPIMDGCLQMGRWQRIFLVELDHGREREVIVHLVGE